MDFNYRHVDLASDNSTIFPRDYQLKKRQEQCDQSSFFCPTGSCFTDADNGWVGCCTTTSCAPRTRCIAYNPATTHDCDVDTGGCLYCSDPANPGCMVITNSVANQWIMYCATTAGIEHVGYVNVITTGSIWTNPSALTTPASPSAAVTPSDIATSTLSISTIPSSTTSSSSSVSSPSSTTSAPTSTSTSSASLLITSAATTTSSIASDSTTSTSTSSATAISLNEVSQSSKTPTGAIAGAAVGGAMAVLILAAIIFLVLRYKKYHRKKDQLAQSDREKDSQYDQGLMDSAQHTPVEVEGSMPREPSQYYSPSGFSPYHEADSKAVISQPVEDKKVVDGLGIASPTSIVNQPARYRLSNPDAITAKPHQRASVASQLVSPLISQSITSEESTPLTPRPNHDSMQYDGQDTPYSMSVYWDQPPGSITNTNDSRPPSLPQPYSLSELPAQRSPGKTSPDTPATVIQRASGRDSPSPWAYLSPERAREGGWVNPREDIS